MGSGICDWFWKLFARDSITEVLRFMHVLGLLDNKSFVLGIGKDKDIIIITSIEFS